jgi:hypothetical protein
MSINDQIDFKDTLANPDLRFALYRLPAGPRPACADQHCSPAGEPVGGRPFACWQPKGNKRDIFSAA